MIKTTILLLAVMTLAAAVTNPIIIKGKKFFDSVTGTQFYMVGVDYQPSGDPIADLDGLRRDIPYFTSLGVNTIRCYQTIRSVNHDAGMSLLSQAGIYVLIDMSTPSESVVSSAPSWTTDLFDSYRGNLDAFSKYDNTLGYIAGNEVILADGTSNSGAFVKASIRDIKSYLAAKGIKKYVGYAAADVPVAYDFQALLNCDTVASSADFYGVNIYRWCGDANLQTSGYGAFAERWANYSIPIVFTEYGCNQVSPRQFTEVQAIYSQPMSDVISGGLVYEYHQEVNNYGLVSLDNGVVTPLQDFYTLKAQLSTINPPRAQLNSYNPSLKLETCPVVTSAFRSASSPLPPVPNSAACKCMFNQLSCRTASEDAVNASPDTNSKIGSVLDYLCGNYPSTCQQIGTDASVAQYGQWSHCNALERVSYAMNQYFITTGGSQASSCDFGGLGTVATPTTPASTQCQNTANNVPLAGGSTPTPTSSTTQNTPTPTSSANTPAPSTTSANAPATSSSSGGPTCEKASYCAPTACACNGACYDQSQYCCVSGQLTQLTFCPKSNPATSSATSASPSASTRPATSANTPATSSSSATPAPSTTSANAPATSSSSGGLTCEKASYCAPTACACSGACYSQSSYCCKSGQLTQIAFC